MKDINERKFISIQAKISPEAAAKLDDIVVKYSFGNYIQSYSLKPLKGCKFSN